MTESHDQCAMTSGAGEEQPALITWHRTDGVDWSVGN